MDVFHFCDEKKNKHVGVCRKQFMGSFSIKKGQEKVGSGGQRFDGVGTKSLGLKKG